MAKTILVVDDDALTLKIASHTLEKDPNYTVLTANSGMAAFDRMSVNKVDLVLLDIEMPVLDGIKTFEMIKKYEKFAGIPVMFVTSVFNKKSIVDAAMMGAVGYVKKPFEPDDLLERVKKVLGE